MKGKVRYVTLLPVYIPLLALFLGLAIGWSRGVTAMVVNAPVTQRKTVVIDAGHGGVDGGAISCTGKLESAFNLEISVRLNDLMHLLGINTVMIRTDDSSVYTQGTTIAQKKISDLKERVRIVNQQGDTLLVSIHQNQFTDNRYSGAQVFYAPTAGSDILAKVLQKTLIQTVNPGSNRVAKRADGVYLMRNIKAPGILVECGFLSNPQEEAKLRSSDYQKKLCTVIATSVSTYLFS